MSEKPPYFNPPFSDIFRFLFFAMLPNVVEIDAFDIQILSFWQTCGTRDTGISQPANIRPNMRLWQSLALCGYILQKRPNSYLLSSVVKFLQKCLKNASNNKNNHQTRISISRGVLFIGQSHLSDET